MIHHATVRDMIRDYLLYATYYTEDDRTVRAENTGSGDSTVVVILDNGQRFAVNVKEVTR